MPTLAEVRKLKWHIYSEKISEKKLTPHELLYYEVKDQDYIV